MHIEPALPAILGATGFLETMLQPSPAGVRTRSYVGAFVKAPPRLVGAGQSEEIYATISGRQSASIPGPASVKSPTSA